MKTHYIKTPEGSYKSTCFGNPKEIYLDNYWSNEKNRSTIYQQVANVIEKNELVKKELSYKGRFLEIACAPGKLLADVNDKYEHVVGLETDYNFFDEIESIAQNAWLVQGFFPECANTWEDSEFTDIVALDVIEHVEDGQRFLDECSRIMVQGGKLVIQAPILLSDEYELPEHQYHEIEHIWIYHIDHLKSMAAKAGFKHHSTTIWKAGHEQVTFVKL